MLQRRTGRSPRTTHMLRLSLHSLHASAFMPVSVLLRVWRRPSMSNRSSNREFTPPRSTLRASLALQSALTRFGGLTHSTSRLFDARAQPPQPHASLHSLHASASMPVLPLPPRLQPPCLRRLMNHACAASAVALRCGRALSERRPSGRFIRLNPRSRTCCSSCSRRWRTRSPTRPHLSQVPVASPSPCLSPHPHLSPSSSPPPQVLLVALIRRPAPCATAHATLPGPPRGARSARSATATGATTAPSAKAPRFRRRRAAGGRSRPCATAHATLPGPPRGAGSASQHTATDAKTALSARATRLRRRRAEGGRSATASATLLTPLRGARSAFRATLTGVRAALSVDGTLRRRRAEKGQSAPCATARATLPTPPRGARSARSATATGATPARSASCRHRCLPVHRRCRPPPSHRSASARMCGRRQVMAARALQSSWDVRLRVVMVTPPGAC